MKQLLKDLVKLSYEKSNSHLMSCLTALPIIVDIHNRNPETIFILSKGHAWFAYAAFLLSKGYKPDLYLSHPNRDPQNKVWCTTGSLGHGLPIGIGIALGDPDCHIDVLCGDAECLEGTFWESLHIIEALDIQNITIHIDANDYGATGKVFDNPTAFLFTLPCIKVHQTKRGEGVKLYEQNPEWHNHIITDAEYKQIIEELK